jgi:hypothetical protein
MLNAILSSAKLRRKFKEMYSVVQAGTTGDPHCPEHIRTAKHLHIGPASRIDQMQTTLRRTKSTLGLKKKKMKKKIMRKAKEKDSRTQLQGSLFKLQLRGLWFERQEVEVEVLGMVVQLT